MTIIDYLIFSIFPLGMAYAAASDVFTMTIPNRVVLIVGAAFFAAAPFLPGMDLSTFGLHLAAGAVVLVVSFALFGFGWIGGGDAKIAAVAAMWIGLPHTLEFLVWTSLVGGGLTLVLMIARRRLLPAFAVRQEWIMRLHDSESGVPYGVALAAGALIVYPQTMWVALIGG